MELQTVLKAEVSRWRFDLAEGAEIKAAKILHGSCRENQCSQQSLCLLRASTSRSQVAVTRAGALQLIVELAFDLI